MKMTEKKTAAKDKSTTKRKRDTTQDSLDDRKIRGEPT